jgi:hypothetical protein
MPTTLYQRTAMAAAIAACFPGVALAAGVARVDFAAGSVSATAPDGRSRALTKGSEIEVGETVATQQGRAQLRFADGAYMSLQPQTEFKVEEFKYSGRDEPSDGIVMNLLKGGLRTITGLVGRTNRNAYRLKTDVATIGIRGTEYSVRYTNSIEVHVTDGVVSVDNQSGSFTIPGGTTVQVDNQQTPPQQTDQKPVLPPESPVQEQEQIAEALTPPPNPFPPPTTTTILTGTITGNWAISLAGGFGIVAHDVDQTIVLDPSGVLTSFADALEFPGGTTTIGTAVGASQGNDGIIAWGRWAGGTTGGTNGLSGADLNDLTGEGPSPLHYVVGLPATNLPALGMMATYSIIGATTPSLYTPPFSGGLPSASVLDSSLVVHFGTSVASLNVKFDVGGNIASGGNIPLNLNGARFNGSGSVFGGSFCGGINAAGFLAGEGGVRAGMAYVVDGCAQTGCGRFNGAIAYQRGTVVPSDLQQQQFLRAQ